jgi:hypothetical protein
MSAENTLNVALVSLEGCVSQERIRTLLKLFRSIASLVKRILKIPKIHVRLQAVH